MADAQPTDEPAPETPPPDDHYPGEGCVTLWLKFSILMAVISLLVAPWMVNLPGYREILPYYDDWMLLPYMLSGVVSIVCLTALLNRRMWGFVGLWVNGLLGVALHITAGMRVAQAVSSLIGLVLLYWLLQIGGERSWWARLK